MNNKKDEKEKELEPQTRLLVLQKKVETLQSLVMYVIGCQAAIESILAKEGLTTHRQINRLALASMEEQKKLMTEALNKMKEISDPIQ